MNRASHGKNFIPGYCPGPAIPRLEAPVVNFDSVKISEPSLAVAYSRQKKGSQVRNANFKND
uniref:Uncharacterized protein n=1 Tax=Romanomermis culicivorax TaxID=13658 RepID=A0A915HJC6_ROMCU